MGFGLGLLRTQYPINAHCACYAIVELNKSITFIYFPPHTILIYMYIYIRISLNSLWIQTTIYR